VFFSGEAPGGVVPGLRSVEGPMVWVNDGELWWCGGRGRAPPFWSPMRELLSEPTPPPEGFVSAPAPMRQVFPGFFLSLRLKTPHFLDVFRTRGKNSEVVPAVPPRKKPTDFGPPEAARSLANKAAGVVPTLPPPPPSAPPLRASF